MFFLFDNALTQEWADSFIKDFEANPNKKLENELDSSFDDRVLLLQNIDADSGAGKSFATIVSETAKVLAPMFKVPALYCETAAIVKWNPGQSMLLHKDGNNEHTKGRTHSVVLYLNDVEKGGEIYFPQLGIEGIKPRRGQLLAYEARYLHGVRETQEDRYTVSIWYSVDPKYQRFIFQ